MGEHEQKALGLLLARGLPTGNFRCFFINKAESK